MDEIWKEIPETEGYYEISNKGRLRSWHNHGHGKSCKPKIKEWSKDSNNYEVSVIYVNTRPINIKAHRVIAKAFIPNPENKPHINHINNIPYDNRIENLEWCTQSENIKHMFDTGRKSLVGENHNQNKLTKHDVVDIRNTYKNEDVTQKELAKMFGVTSHCISSVVRRKTWKHI